MNFYALRPQGDEFGKERLIARRHLRALPRFAIVRRELRDATQQLHGSVRHILRRCSRPPRIFAARTMARLAFLRNHGAWRLANFWYFAGISSVAFALLEGTGAQHGEQHGAAPTGKGHGRLIVAFALLDLANLIDDNRAWRSRMARIRCTARTSSCSIDSAQQSALPVARQPRRYASVSLRLFLFVQMKGAT